MTKKMYTILVMVMLVAASSIAFADTTKDAVKAQKNQNKLTHELVNQKASKDAKKQAKELKKEGWKVSAGSLALEKQIDRAMLMEAEIDASGNPVWIAGEAQTVGENIDGARFQALEMAKLMIIQQMEQEIAAGVENALGNQELSADEAATTTRTIANTRSIMKQTLAAVRPTVMLHRKLGNGNSEVIVRIFYSHADMVSRARQALRNELLKESKELGDKVDCIINGICPIPVE